MVWKTVFLIKARQPGGLGLKPYRFQRALEQRFDDRRFAPGLIQEFQPDVLDDGSLDQPCESVVVDGKLIVVNFDWPGRRASCWWQRIGQHPVRTDGQSLAR